MSLNVSKEIAALGRMTVKELRARYADVFGEETPAHNKTWLVRRLAWRIQALAEGDLSARARQRAGELANDADLRMNPPKVLVTAAPVEQTEPRVLRFKLDDRLPPPGTLLSREYKGTRVQVKVLPYGFEYEGQVYRSLSAVTKAITGSHVNGYFFFNLGGKGGDQ